ncbi:hypothetical protein HHL23_22060 [Chryseobacterium sp. RP-3-3]|uniref:CD-NTase associated protein 4-like DNA endonuclease domain-containing protein n=1 Tax=Chryseobacterium antibioticum TaxID=2728847 RepID=A0A7Y0AS08_9FLAO|nr:hypothetical protein [Chryseobacterium antibioticum]NML72444.1 hypothetical protein [Chryseobacterium antibioticum]
MAKTTTPQEQRAVGPQSIGFDYQFYYFMYLSLKLKHGQKIGYEVKDDIHIDKEDGSTILLQAKHSTVEKADGSIQNLTTMDLDMWKSLNNWALFINSAESKSDFLGSHSFILVTNKSENNNEFISSLAQFNEDLDVNTIIEKIKSLEKSTTSKTLQGYINNILKIGKRSLIVFFLKLSIETGVDAGQTHHKLT